MSRLLIFSVLSYSLFICLFLSVHHMSFAQIWRLPVESFYVGTPEWVVSASMSGSHDVSWTLSRLFICLTLFWCISSCFMLYYAIFILLWSLRSLFSKERQKGVGEILGRGNGKGLWGVDRGETIIKCIMWEKNKLISFFNFLLIYSLRRSHHGSPSCLTIFFFSLPSPK